MLTGLPQALARAVYSAASTVILDDSFSALDGKTEARVLTNLLGPEGLLRKMGASVLWITNSSKFSCNPELAAHRC